MTYLDRTAQALALILPVTLIHGRGLAEAIVITLAALFLARSALTRDWTWLRRPWVRIALAWWAWLLLCSSRQGWANATWANATWDSAAQAAGVVRFLLLTAAMEHWVLAHAQTRLWLARILRLAAAYLAAQSLLQFATGRNLYGFPRSGDGELTGPYRNPRAGAPLSRLLFPAILPLIVRWLAQPPWWRLAGLVLLPLSVATMVLIGQRMPLLLTGLGLLTTALLLPRLRPLVLGAALVASLLLAATPLVSPPTFTRLVTKFTAQMESFPESHYGLIAARALVIAEAHPTLGAGFDGFRRDCPDPAYFQGWRSQTDGGGAEICVQHPHNFYLQALVEGGIPGLALFSLLALAWLTRLARHLWRHPDPLRAGLFAAALIQLWPLASTTAFTSMPLAGLFFVLLGLGLAEANALVPAQASANIRASKEAAVMSLPAADYRAPPP